MSNSIVGKVADRRKISSIKLVLYSALGIFMFFASLTIGTRTTIPIDHIVKTIQKVPYFMPVYGGIMITIGTILPFANKSWRKDKTTTVFSLLNIIGMATAYMAIFMVGPAFILDPNMAPYVFTVVVVPVVTIVPVGSIFLAFLVDYGLMDFIGILMKPIMKPIFRTPGRSAIDAVASFVGSYSLALLVTNGVYKEGKYNAREASIIATGFSTVSATFMIILASTLGLMEYWTTYFWVTLVITFIVSAITARIYPLNKIPAEYYNNQNPPVEPEDGRKIMIRAWDAGVDAMELTPSLAENVTKNLKAGIRLAINIGPNIMSIGILALLAAEYTPIFDYMAYLFYPITSLLKIPDAMLVAKASAITLADMYVPAIIATEASLTTRFIIAIVCISEILFLSASIPCILSTDIPISLKDIVLVWFWRVVLSLLIATPIVYLIF